MKKRIYLKIGETNRGRIKVEASIRPNYTPIKTLRNYCPTVLIALDIDIPDKEFEATRILLEGDILPRLKSRASNGRNCEVTVRI